MKPNPINWCEIYVQDMDRARKFYEEVFQTKLQKLDSPTLEMWAFPMEKGVPGAGVALVKMDGVPSGGSGTIPYFHCEDVANEESRVAKAGGRVHRPKMSIREYGFISLVVDTDGNMIGMHMPAANDRPS